MEDSMMRVEFTPAVITCDFAGMRKTLNEKYLEPYHGMTDEGIDSMTAQEVYQQRSNLSAMKKEIEEGRKGVKRAYNEPLKAFEDECRKLVDDIDGYWGMLDANYKKREERDRKERRENLESIYADFAPALVEAIPFERVLESSWLTKTGSKTAEKELTEKVSGIAKSWEALQAASLNCPKETEARFFQTLDLTDALSFDARKAEEYARIAAAKDDVASCSNKEQTAPQIEPEKRDEYIGAWTICIERGTSKQMRDFAEVLKEQGLSGVFKRGTIKQIAGSL